MPVSTHFLLPPTYGFGVTLSLSFSLRNWDHVAESNFFAPAPEKGSRFFLRPGEHLISVVSLFSSAGVVRALLFCM